VKFAKWAAAVIFAMLPIGYGLYNSYTALFLGYTSGLDPDACAIGHDCVIQINGPKATIYGVAWLVIALIVASGSAIAFWKGYTGRR
jgi:hypothetical protein